MIKNAKRFPVSCFITLYDKPYIVYIDAQFNVRGIEPIHYRVNNINANVQMDLPHIKVYSDKLGKGTIVLDGSKEIFVIR